VLQPLGEMVSQAGMRSTDIKAGCGKCGACSSLSVYESGEGHEGSAGALPAVLTSAAALSA